MKPTQAVKAHASATMFRIFWCRLTTFSDETSPIRTSVQRFSKPYPSHRTNRCRWKMGLYSHYTFHESSFVKWDPPNRDLLSKSFHLIYIYILTMFWGSFKNHMLRGRILKFSLSRIVCRTNRAQNKKLRPPLDSFWCHEYIDGLSKWASIRKRIFQGNPVAPFCLKI